MAKAKRPAPDMTRVEASHEEVWDIYRKLPRPSIANAYKEFKRLNPDKKLSQSAVKRWACKYGWLDKLARLAVDGNEGVASDRQRLTAVLAKLRLFSGAVSASSMKGIQGRLIEKIMADIELITLDNVDKIEHCLDIIQRLKVLEHDLRGDSIREKDSTTADGGDSAPTSVINYADFPAALRSPPVRSS